MIKPLKSAHIGVDSKGSHDTIYTDILCYCFVWVA